MIGYVLKKADGKYFYKHEMGQDPEFSKELRDAYVFTKKSVAVAYKGIQSSRLLTIYEVDYDFDNKMIIKELGMING